MKTKIHPKYFDKTTVTCSCDNEFVVGSTLEKLEVEVCSQCHPFYTGKQKLVDVAGRIDKFRKRLDMAEQAVKTKPTKKKAETKDKKDKKDDNTITL